MANIFGRERAPHEVPDDSPDLSYVMSFVTSVGGLAAYYTRRSTLGLLSGLTVGATFAVGGYWIGSNSPERHEMAHQMCLISSVLFMGAMGYRAGSNPYVGPGGSMLAALGGVSSAYHLTKFMAWNSYEQSRVKEAEALIRKYHLQQEAPPAPAPSPVAELAAQQQQAQQQHGRVGSFPPHHRGGPPPLNRQSPVPPGGF